MAHWCRWSSCRSCPPPSPPSQLRRKRRYSKLKGGQRFRSLPALFLSPSFVFVGEGIAVVIVGIGPPAGPSAHVEVVELTIHRIVVQGGPAAFAAANPAWCIDHVAVGDGAVADHARLGPRRQGHLAEAVRARAPSPR